MRMIVTTLVLLAVWAAPRCEPPPRQIEPGCVPAECESVG